MNPKGIRPVTIASICGPKDDPAAILRLVEEAAKNKPDLILLPENWQDCSFETLGSETIGRLRVIAAEHGVYIVHATVLADGKKFFNTTLLIDRAGDIAGRYDKAYPYWEEFTEGLPAPVSPGQSECVFACDFGRIGIAICFDANFPLVWAEMARRGAELVLWSSAYAAGYQLAAHALNHHYPIVTATNTGHCMVFDLDGRRILSTQSPGLHIEYVSLDLDRCIFHENFNQEKLAALLAEDPRRVEIEKHFPEEQWIIVRSAMPEQSARECCAQAGMEELRAYKRRSKEVIDWLR